MSHETSSDSALQCPKCQSPMRQLDAGSCTVDRCEQCYGIWLDKGERLKVLQDASLTTGLDIGDAHRGEAMDEITEIDCPRCGKRMIHMRDVAQKHVGFEFCRKCEGSFFDAGELRDLGTTTMIERLRAFFGA